MIRTEGRREGDSIVGANERRRAILEVLCQRKQDTMKNLANEFHVSLRTVSAAPTCPEKAELN